jgi:hypothetical protein
MNESFWLAPSHLLTDNTIQGEFYDMQMYENTHNFQDLLCNAATHI